MEATPEPSRDAMSVDALDAGAVAQAGAERSGPHAIEEASAANGTANGHVDAHTEPVERSAFCTACGTRNGADANYCKQCGHRLDKTGPIRLTEEQFALPVDRAEQVRDLLLLAYRQHEALDNAAAIRTCARALEIAPDSTDAHSLMSTLYERTGERTLAIAERERVLALNPGSIADREKLDELRDGTLAAPRKVISSHRSAGTPIWDSPTGAGMLAVGVAVFVLAAGAIALVVNRSHRPETVRAESGQSAIASAPGFGAQPPYQSYGQFPSGQWAPGSAFPYSSPQAAPGATQQSAATSVRPPAVRRSEFPDGPPAQRRALPPAQIGAVNDLVAEPTNSRPDRSGAATVHLPDNNGLSSNEIGPPPAGSGTQPSPAVAPQSAPPPQTNHGRIEIVVSPNASGQNQQGASGSPSQGGDVTLSSMDSRSQRRVAQDLQLRSQYKQAATAYIKALDGAGDDAAEIHQQIGMCYQRLNDYDSAIAQYNQAISAYKSLISAGKSTDEAQRGIRTCESAIKACQ